MEQQIAEQMKLGQKNLADLNCNESIVTFTKVVELDEENVNAYCERVDAFQILDNIQKWQQITVPPFN